MKKLICLAFLFLSPAARADNAVTLYDSANHYIQIKAPNVMSQTYKLIMPLSQGATGQVLALASVAGNTATFAWSSAAGGGAWGSISGTLSAQTDLQTALNNIGVSTGSLQGQINGLGSTYLTLSSATATYLQSSSATATYLQSSVAAGTYLSMSSATATYAFKNQITGLQTQINSIGLSTGSLRTDLNATALSTQTLANAVGSSTASLRTDLNAVRLATGTISTSVDDSVMVGNGTGMDAKAISDCQGAGKAMTYTAATNTFGCNTISAGSGGSSLAIGTGTTSGYAGVITSSPSLVLLFDNATTKGVLQGGGTYFFTLNSGSVTLQGNSINLANLQTQANNIGLSTGTIQTQVNSVALATGTIQTQLNSVAQSTGTLLTQINTKVNFSSFSATQPILYNSATGAFSATLISLSTGVVGTLPVANGGTGTATPSLVQGANITITGSWPNQTIAATAGSGVLSTDSTTWSGVYNWPNVNPSTFTNLVVTTLTITGAIIMNGPGTWPIFTPKADPVDYRAVLTSSTLTVGHYALISSTNGAIIDGGIPSGSGVPSINSYGNPAITSSATILAGTNVTLGQSGNTITINASGGSGSPAGPAWSVQVSSAGSLGGFANFLNNGSTITISSVFSLVLDNISSMTLQGIYFDTIGSTFNIVTVTSSVVLQDGVTSWPAYPHNPHFIGGNFNGPMQTNIQNFSTGSNAASEYCATSDTGNNTKNFACMGINNSGFSNATWPYMRPQSAYLISSDSDVVVGAGTLGTDPGAQIIFVTSATTQMVIKSTSSDGYGIVISTRVNAPNIPQVYMLQVDSTTNGTGNASTPISFPVLANTTYYIDCYLLFQTTTTTTGIAFALNTPSAPGAISYTVGIPIAADAAAGMFWGWGSSSDDYVTGTAVQAINTTYVARLYGSLQNGANAGNLVVRFHSELAGQDAKLKNGSMCTLLTNPGKL